MKPLFTKTETRLQWRFDAEQLWINAFSDNPAH
jgi:hypothetical protein